MMTQPIDTPGLSAERRKQRRRSGRDHHGSPDHAGFHRARTRPGTNGQLLSHFSSQKSHLATPLLPWRYARAFPPVSARKLAAELWCLQRSYSACEEGNRRRLEIGASISVPNALMERAAEWNTSQAHCNMYRVHGNKKLLKSYMNDASVLTSLASNLQLACTRVCKLETDHQRFRTKLNHFLRKLSEERSAWQRMEHLQVQERVEVFKHDLRRERKSRRKLEILNSNLNNVVDDAKQSVKCFVQDYGKERKARELIDQVCDELTKENGKNKAEKEAIKKESMKILEEVEEEKEMLQMAEAWREERVQMKLLEAKMILERKFSQLRKVKGDLEAFIRSRPEVTDVVEVKQESELSMPSRIDTIKVLERNDQLSHQPPTSPGTLFPNDISQSGHANDRLANSSLPYSPHGDALNDDGSRWETVTQDEEHSSSTPGGSCPSMGLLEETESPVSDNGLEWKETYPNKETLNVEKADAHPALVKQCSKAAPSISKLRRSDTIEGDCYEAITIEENNGKVWDGVNFKESVEVGNKLVKKGGRRCCPTPANPHVNRGMKGCIEWPRNNQKNVFKSNFLEAKIESQKVRLRQILKQNK